MNKFEARKDTKQIVESEKPELVNIRVIHRDGTHGIYNSNRGWIRWDDGHMDTLDADVVAEYIKNYSDTLELIKSL